MIEVLQKCLEQRAKGLRWTKLVLEAMNIKDLEIGKSAKITKVGGSGALRQHFLDMGLIPGAQITMIKFAPMGDPAEIKIHGYELTLRLADAEKIEIDKPYTAKADSNIDARKKDISHPGLGEGGKFHTKTGENHDLVNYDLAAKPQNNHCPAKRRRTIHANLHPHAKSRSNYTINFSLL